nr:hypothetical protein [Miniimonas sp. S16]
MTTGAESSSSASNTSVEPNASVAGSGVGTRSAASGASLTASSPISTRSVPSASETTARSRWTSTASCATNPPQPHADAGGATTSPTASTSVAVESAAVRGNRGRGTRRDTTTSGR